MDKHRDQLLRALDLLVQGNPHEAHPILMEVLEEFHRDQPGSPKTETLMRIVNWLDLGEAKQARELLSQFLWHSAL